MAKVKEWLLRFWKWIALGVVAILSIFVGKRLLKKDVVVQPGPSPKQVEEDAKAHEKAERVRIDKEVKQEVIERSHEDKVNAHMAKVEELTGKVSDDPVATNSHLQNIGKHMRE